jgi:CDGSH-type Zn-finger protein
MRPKVSLAVNMMATDLLLTLTQLLKESKMTDPVTIRIRDDGPALIEGPVTILDGDGKPFSLDPTKSVVAICRCGESGNRPFCDGSHRSCGFSSRERSPD